MAARPQAPRQAAHAALERPSLFAQPHEGDEDPDMQRVQILSTLESARRPSRPVPSTRRKSRRPSAPGAGHWQAKALIGLMAAGLLSLLASLVLLLFDKPDAPPAPSGAAAIQVDRQNPLAALVVARTDASPARAAPPPEAALIENLPADPMAALTQASAPLFPIDDAVLPLPDAAAPPKLAAPAIAPQAALPDMGVAPTAVAHAMPPRSPPVALPKADKPAPRRAARTESEDVALLEAVLAHTATRGAATPPVPVTEALQQCEKRSGGAAATCRARICVQHPGTSACHDGP